MHHGKKLARFAMEQQNLITNESRRPTVPQPGSNNHSVQPISRESLDDAQSVLNNGEGAGQSAPVFNTSPSGCSSPCHGFPTPRLGNEWEETPIGHGQMSVFSGGRPINDAASDYPSLELVRDLNQLKSWMAPFTGEAAAKSISQYELNRLRGWTKGLQSRWDQEYPDSPCVELEQVLLVLQSLEIVKSPDQLTIPPMSSRDLNDSQDEASVDRTLENAMGLMGAVQSLSNTQNEASCSHPDQIRLRLNQMPNPETLLQEMYDIRNTNLELINKLGSDDLVARVSLLERQQLSLTDSSRSLVSSYNEMTRKFNELLDGCKMMQEIASKVNVLESRLFDLDKFANSQTSYNDMSIANHRKVVKHMEDLNKDDNSLRSSLANMDMSLKHAANCIVELNNRIIVVENMISSSDQVAGTQGSISPIHPTSGVASDSAIPRSTPPVYTRASLSDMVTTTSMRDILNLDIPNPALHAPLIPTPVSSPPGVSADHRPPNVASAARSVGYDISRTASNSSLNSLASESSIGRIQERRIKRSVDDMKDILKQQLSVTLSDTEIIDLHTNVLKDLAALAKESDNTAIQYAKIPDHDTALLDLIGEVVNDAYTWINRLKTMYRTRQLHLLSNKNKTMIDSISLKKFTGDSTQTIFEFFKSFDELTKCTHTADQKAMLLYNTYLDEKIKQEVALISTDFSMLRTHLINKYGKAKHIIDVKLSVLKNTNMTDAMSADRQADHMRLVYSVLAEIQNLGQSSQISKESIARYGYSHEALSLVVRSLPNSIIRDFFKEIGRVGFDADDYEGTEAFNILLQFVQTGFKNLSAAAKLGKEGNQKATTSTHHVFNVNPDQEATPTVTEPSKSVHFHQSLGPSTTSKRWYNQSLRHPCPMPDHDHEVGGCSAFFALPVKDRFNFARSKLCFCCMGPWDKCSKTCHNIKSVPIRLICQECLVAKFPTRNILLCKKADHIRTDIKTVLKELSTYFPEFVIEEMAKVIPTSVNVVNMEIEGSCHLSSFDSQPTFSSPPNPDSKTPIINTMSGKCVDVDEKLVIQESSEEATYILQTLNLKGEDCLCFYDSGANQHLIDGQLAESADLKVVSSRSVPIGVVGGGRIWTEYGMYNVILGPDNHGHYHELKCQGIKRITSELPVYDLSPINKDVRKCNQLNKSDSLPQRIGGTAIKLLIGIKDAALGPVALWSLPCGLTVYRSQLRDKFGSNICYGGPHTLFTQINKQAHGDINLINVFFSKAASAYHSSIYSSIVASELDFEYHSELPTAKLRDQRNNYCLLADNEVDIALYPSPLSIEDTKVFDPQLILDSKDIPVPGMERIMHLSVPPQGEIERGHYFVDRGGRNVVDSNSTELEFHHCSVLKAKIPLNRLVKLVDEDDIDKLVNYRCTACSKCVECQESDRTKTQTLQDRIDHDVIRKSITIDTENNKVIVGYPWTQDPVKYLSKFHKGADDNYIQALKSYQQQCRKPETVKAGVRSAHKELVDKGFMVRLSDLPLELKQSVLDGKFKHYFIWSSVVKESESTPVRLVVDPSRTGFNHVVAKGENNMAKIIDILIRSRCHPFVFSTDISKLYNQLHLHHSALPFSLFLFSEELDPNHVPTIWVLVRAWYGIRSTGNQAGEALTQLANLCGDDNPLGKEAILKDRYVDDILSGAFKKDEMDKRIMETQQILGSGGFSLKFVARCRELVPAKASSDANMLKVLGYRWFPVKDKFAPGFSEVNFSQKIRGVGTHTTGPISRDTDISKVLSGMQITRRMVVAKMGEIYDPLGLWEPFKLQLKLDIAALNGTDWDTPIAEDYRDLWISRFRELTEIPSLEVPRCVVPVNAIDPKAIRLLGVSDAAESAGGAAIYASYMLSDGTYSCQLLVAKSKLMDMSIPRNELSAILIMSELLFLVCKSLGTLVDKVHLFTDSSIAMCWCMNVNKKLRMFTFNRVATIRRYVEWSIGSYDELPLYNIAGNINPADLMTKKLPITPMSLAESSDWIAGKPWMRLPVDQMPIRKYSDLTLSPKEKTDVAEECFVEFDLDYSGRVPVENADHIPATSIFNLECSNTNNHCQGCQNYMNQAILKCYGSLDISGHCQACTCVSNPLDPSVFVVKRSAPPVKPILEIVSVGWLKAVKSVTVLGKFVAWIIHKTHSNTKQFNIQESLRNKCPVCMYMESSMKTKLTRSKSTSAYNFFLKNNYFIGERYWFLVASRELEVILDKKSLDSYEKKNGIFYYSGRLSNEFPVTSTDLDIDEFFDNTDFQAVTPVIHASSAVFYAFLIYVHDTLRPHSGIEVTIREVSKKMHVIANARAVISKVRKDCVKCRLLIKKTLELEMAKHRAPRTTLAPPFHSIQIDVVYGGFTARSWKRSRQRYEIYALVVVCLLSSATNILVLEGLETQDVVQALERHSHQYGVPLNVYVDSGSQLVTLSAVTANIRDINSIVHDSLGMNIKVSNPKSHEERGRVEAKVKVIRSMISKLSVDNSHAMTALSWQTLFSKIASDIDNVPMCKGNASNAADFGFDIITPNRLKLGRNNYRALEDSFLLDSGTEVDLLEKYRRTQTVWYQVLLDRLHYLIPKPMKWQKTDPIDTDTIVVFILKDAGVLKREQWSLGLVVESTGTSLKIKYFSAGRKSPLFVYRSPRQVSVIFKADDLPVNTVEYYETNVVPLSKVKL